MVRNRPTSARRPLGRAGRIQLILEVATIITVHVAFCCSTLGENDVMRCQLNMEIRDRLHLWHLIDADIVDQVAQWRDSGLQYAVVANLSGVQPSLRRGLAASLSFTRVLRGLRKL